MKSKYQINEIEITTNENEKKIKLQRKHQINK